MYNMYMCKLSTKLPDIPNINWLVYNNRVYSEDGKCFSFKVTFLSNKTGIFVGKTRDDYPQC